MATLESSAPNRRRSTPAASSRKLTRTDVNFWLDFLLLVLFLALCTLSVILEFIFPVGPQADGWLLWGYGYGEWSRIRFLVLAVMAAAIVLHVMLHWSWVCGVVASRLGAKKSGGAAHDDPSRTLWGVGLLIVAVNLIGLVVALAALTIQSPATGP
ncbi:MAG: DUF4405 domain-containing protein [Pirellulales bacterium]